MAQCFKIIVAPLAASIGGRPAEDAPEWRIPEPEKPLSVITIHGLADDDIPYEGGISRHRGGPAPIGR
jgi:polyhydroxybutyrate depolymerase